MVKWKKWQMVEYSWEIVENEWKKVLEKNIQFPLAPGPTLSTNNSLAVCSLQFECVTGK